MTSPVLAHVPPCVAHMGCAWGVHGLHGFRAWHHRTCTPHASMHAMHPWHAPRTLPVRARPLPACLVCAMHGPCMGTRSPCMGCMGIACTPHLEACKWHKHAHVSLHTSNVHARPPQALYTHATCVPRMWHARELEPHAWASHGSRPPCTPCTHACMHMHYHANGAPNACPSLTKRAHT